MEFSLVLLNGVTPGTGLVLDSSDPPITIGRDPARDLHVDNDLCSRLHARVWFDGQQWQIEDCGSRNGTFLNSRRVERATLQTGDVIRVGEQLLVFVRESEPGQQPDPRLPYLDSPTTAVRVPASQQQQAVVEQLYSLNNSGSIRNAEILCRLAGEIPKHDNVPALLEFVGKALAVGTEADDVVIWLVGTDGRLKPVYGSATAGQTAPSMLACLALENDEALLIRPSAETSPAASQNDSWTDAGSAICLPIPHRSGRRGAIECLRRVGRQPFVHENLDLTMAVAHQVGLALENLEYREQLEQANQQLRETITDEIRILGESHAIRGLQERIARVATTHSTVLITGESGTGKELVARMIHESSDRRAGPYISVNCAAFSESLLESELFGHEKGAFTGADRRRLGQFERAHRGTIFLDEVGEMSPACQVKLLRLLEGHPFERVGGSESIQVDVRIICATHRHLKRLIKHGTFREDLYYRLRVIELTIPPLRERGDDALDLAAHFVERFRRETGRGPSRLSRQAAEAIFNYAWPGNVRELQNAVERAVVLGQAEEVLVEDLGLPEPGVDSDQEIGTLALADVERRHIHKVLRLVRGNKTQACKILGIGRGTLYKKLQDSEGRSQV